MKCPHCETTIHLEVEVTTTWETADYEKSHIGYNVACGHCPECKEFIVLLRHGIAEFDMNSGYLDSVTNEMVLYPKFLARKVEPEVPERYKKDFKEACSVLQVSAKASAAISRRILQDILIEKFEIKYRSLDNYLNRWTQPDSIIPDGNPQSLNRYSYALGNPIRYNDPTGHCPICLFAVAATLIVDAVALIETAKPVGDNASNIWELMHLGVEHADHANITGAGFQSLENDPSVQSVQAKIVAQISSEPSYGQKPYTIPDDQLYKNFTAGDVNGSWVQGALTGNPSFYMVHSGTLYATNIKVSADGTISTTWEVRDNFDYLPAWGDHKTRPNILNYLAYNMTAQFIVDPIYYGLLHAEPQLPTTAQWNQTIYPPVTNSKKLIPQ